MGEGVTHSFQGSGNGRFFITIRSRQGQDKVKIRDSPSPDKVKIRGR